MLGAPVSSTILDFRAPSFAAVFGVAGSDCERAAVPSWLAGSISPAGTQSDMSHLSSMPMSIDDVPFLLGDIKNEEDPLTGLLCGNGDASRDGALRFGHVEVPETTVNHFAERGADVAALLPEGDPLRSFLSDEDFGAPQLCQFESYSSVHSAPALGKCESYESEDNSRETARTAPTAAGKPPKPSSARRSSATAPGYLSSDIIQDLERAIQQSNSATEGGLNGARGRSMAGPGTNRPPKEGSQSALLSEEKLSRKRASARRYYHNQKNKVFDFEDSIKKLEVENKDLQAELKAALERLEFLRAVKAVRAEARAH